MRTEQLIQAMAADTERSRPVEALMLPALALGAVLSSLLFFPAMGVRPDLAEALTHIPVLIKQSLPWVVAVAGVGLALRLARPGADAGRWPLLLAGVVVVLVAAVLLEAIALPPGLWLTAMKGTSLVTCLLSIPLLSIPIAAAVLWAMRSGASTRPRLTGAVAGLTSAGTAAGLYSFYCNDDSPLFYGVWYVAAILAVTAVCAALGPRLLRW